MSSCAYCGGMMHLTDIEDKDDSSEAVTDWWEEYECVLCGRVGRWILRDSEIARKTGACADEDLSVGGWP